MERAGTGLIDVGELMLKGGGGSAFYHSPADARFKAIVAQPMASAGSRSVARSDVPTGLYALNVLPFSAVPEKVSIVKLTAPLRDRPRTIDLGQCGTFVDRGTELWSFVPLPILTTLLEPIVDETSSKSKPRAEIEASQDSKRVLSWLLRKHFEYELLTFEEQDGLILEHGSKHRAYFSGKNKAERTIVWNSAQRRGNRREVVGKILEAIKQRLAENQIKAEVKGREKHIFGIYQKMQSKSLAFSQVLDIYGFRVLVDDVASCYLTLGALHSLYKPFPGKFKDYIAIPKVNGYQSLHTALFGPFGTPIEVQIRTFEMNKIAEAGLASHWLYKTTKTPINDLHKKTHQWLQSLLESLSQSGDSVEFLEHLKIDLFPDEVYVFSPHGKIFALPRGATAVDFAYSVHTDIGNRCVAVKVNFELVPLRTELKNGDRVEIVTAPHAHPNPAWLNYVVTSRARGEIRHALKTMHLDESAALGERLLGQALTSLGVKPQDIPDECWERVLKETGAKSRQEIFADIGLGRRLNMIIARQLARVGEIQGQYPHSSSGAITILGNEGMAMQFAKCCRPIPGDPIIGVIKPGQGLIVHTHDCPTLRKGRSGSEEWLDVAWDKNLNKLFDVSIKLIVANQRGVLAKVASSIAEAESNIENVHFSNEGEYTALYFTLQVNNRVHLANVMRNLRRITEVVRITRVKSIPA